MRGFAALAAAFALAAGGVTAHADPVVPGTECSWKSTPLAPSPTVGHIAMTGTGGPGEFTGKQVWAGPDGQVYIDMVLWHRDGSVEIAPPLPAGFMRPSPVDQNSANVVLLNGQSSDPNGAGRTFTFSGGQYRALPVPEGFVRTFGEAINARGDAVGLAYRQNNTSAAVLWPAGTDQAIVLDVPNLVQLVDIDDDRTVLVHTSDGPQLWRHGSMIKLAHPAGYLSPWAGAVRRGKVIGHARTDDGQYAYQGFLWTSPDVVRPIEGNAVAEGINDIGLIIGRATIYSGGGVWFDTLALGDLPNSSLAILISDDNAIVGQVDGRYVIWRWSCVRS